MSKTFIDPDGVEYEVVWDGSMKAPITELTASKPNPIWGTVTPLPPAKSLGKKPSAAKAMYRTSRRPYNKTGKHAKTPNYWLTVDKVVDENGEVAE